MEIVAVDLGGTHVRFAKARVAAGAVAELGPPTTLHTGDYAGMAQAWQAYAAQAGGALPHAAALAIASPLQGDVLKLTNSAWVIRPATLAAELGVQKLTLVNDFGAVGHAVAHLPEDNFQHVGGPQRPLPQQGVIALVGPGTGLGVAHVLRTAADYFVMETEGGHIDFAPVDAVDDGILARLRVGLSRVSAERVISGPGLSHIYEYLVAREGSAGALDNIALWEAALAGRGDVAQLALQRFCMALGSFCGDIVLAQGAQGLVIGGGVGARVGPLLAASDFRRRFTAKGRMTAMLEHVPVKLILHPEPGLYGAAAAFAKEHS